ncbi:unnamed protein product [Eruca vesicaria subsp. sativa]|uniref:Uncharacterized protein n=1 Tax=Eruca vesicaria subsp. sativa TaxID=29727 RepID=A0ABC8JR21_ERUVS|nr:unnamed protein product [Eruca vesicaria subsp. sativa]
MEEEKAAAYYEELTRKGEGAARYKQGLGFSSGNDAVPERASAIASSSSSSFLNQFVKASSNDSDIRSIRDKLKKKPEDQHRSSDRGYRDSSERRRYRSRERDERERRSRYTDRERRRSRSRSRSCSPRRERRRSEDDRRRGRRKEDVKENKKKIDYSRLVKGYDHMSVAEKVKAKMKLQLDETAEKDTSKGAGWERFEFDKDAPLDDEEVEEGTDDDAALVKRMGQSFRFNAIETKREEQLKDAHDEAMFGAPTGHTIIGNSEDDVTETTKVKDTEGENNSGAVSLVSEKVKALSFHFFYSLEPIDYWRSVCSRYINM